MHRTSSMRKSSPIALCIFLAALFLFISSSSGEDTIQPQGALKDGETLFSFSKRYVLGFFSPVGSSSRYLGIWFAVSNNTIVWVANRNKPLNDYSGILRIDRTGDLVLSGQNDPVVWSASQNRSLDTIAQLLDSGNLVIRKGENILWQSFDYPTDTMLPKMKIGRDFKNNRDRYLSSWKNDTDPSMGEYTYKLDSRDTGQPYVRKNDEQIIYRSGPWNGREFSGNQRMRSYSDLTFTVVHNAEEAYYQYDVIQDSTLARLVLEASGYLTRFQWDVEANEWNRRWSAPDDNVCDTYARCGPNAVCNSGSSVQCTCLEGFQPRNPEQWEKQIWRGGCLRRTNLSCGEGDEFLRRFNMKLPDMMKAVVERSMRFEECRGACSRDCSCVAFAPANIREGYSGCVFWAEDLKDLRNFSNGGQELYLRIARADFGKFYEPLLLHSYSIFFKNKKPAKLQLAKMKLSLRRGNLSESI